MTEGGFFIAGVNLVWALETEVTELVARERKAPENKEGKQRWKK